MSPRLRAAWIGLAIVAAVVVPLRILEIWNAQSAATPSVAASHQATAQR